MSCPFKEEETDVGSVHCYVSVCISRPPPWANSEKKKKKKIKEQTVTREITRLGAGDVRKGGGGDRQGGAKQEMSTIMRKTYIVGWQQSKSWSGALQKQTKQLWCYISLVSASAAAKFLHPRPRAFWGRTECSCVHVCVCVCVCVCVSGVQRKYSEGGRKVKVLLSLRAGPERVRVVEAGNSARCGRVFFFFFTFLTHSHPPAAPTHTHTHTHTHTLQHTPTPTEISTHAADVCAITPISTLRGNKTSLSVSLSFAQTHAHLFLLLTSVCRQHTSEPFQ